MVGSQIFKSEDAPRYIPGTIGCAVCFALQFGLIVLWRLVLARRNRKRDQEVLADGLSEEEMVRSAKELGEGDVTDFENRYVSLFLTYSTIFVRQGTKTGTVSLHALMEHGGFSRNSGP